MVPGERNSKVTHEPVREKTNKIWVPNRSDTNRAVQSQKIVRGWKFWISKVEELYYPYSENKGADQFCSYCKADLRLCFRLCKLLVFPCGSSHSNAEQKVKDCLLASIIAIQYYYITILLYNLGFASVNIGSLCWISHLIIIFTVKYVLFTYAIQAQVLCTYRDTISRKLYQFKICQNPYLPREIWTHITPPYHTPDFFFHSFFFPLEIMLGKLYQFKICQNPYLPREIWTHITPPYHTPEFFFFILSF